MNEDTYLVYRPNKMVTIKSIKGLLKENNINLVVIPIYKHKWIFCKYIIGYKAIDKNTNISFSFSVELIDKRIKQTMRKWQTFPIKQLHMNYAKQMFITEFFKIKR